jgi:DNA-binding NtrC family response regulator
LIQRQVPAAVAGEFTSKPGDGAARWGIFRSGGEIFMVNPNLHVLVVDDELLIRWSVAETLAAAGHSVIQAGDGRSAIDALKTAPDIDVVLLDYRLPDSDDLALLRNIRRTAPDAAVVMMTAHGTPEMVEDALALGARQVIAKPFDMHDLEALVQHAHACRSH